jgi:hypothetical protein
MKIIEERTQDTRAERRIRRPFRRGAGPFPVDHRRTFTSNRTHEEIRATMMDRDYSRAHLTQAALAFSRAISAF